MSLWERSGHLGAIVFSTQLVPSQVDALVCFPSPQSNIVLNQIRNIQIISLLGEREELCTGHEVVTSILTQVVRVLVVVLQSVQGE